MSKPNPRLLPEILSCISAYLTKEDAINCIRVCKAWRVEFEPIIWRTFKLVNDPENSYDQPLPAYIQRNAKHIHHLIIKYYIGCNLFPAKFECSQIRTLEITVKEDPWADDEDSFDVDEDEEEDDLNNEFIWHPLTAYLKDHQFLQKIQIHCPGTSITPPVPFWKSLMTCSNLAEIDTQGLCFQLWGTVHYLQVCSLSSVRKVSSHMDDFSIVFSWDDNDVVFFPELQSLSFEETDDYIGNFYVGWITRCPKLTSLTWDSIVDLPIQEFCHRIPTACPNLTSLRLTADLMDRDIAEVLKAMPRIENLYLQEADFAEESIGALRRHFQTLTEINLLGALAPTHEYIQEILSSCPNLTMLRADEILASDLIKQPWVCRQLRTLIIGIRTEPTTTLSDERAVYSRLSEMTELRMLVIGPSMSEVTYDFRTVELSIRAGIESLKSLTHLEYFDPRESLEEAMIANEFEVLLWMLENWKNIKVLVVDIPEGIEGAEEIEARMKERGIETTPLDDRKYSSDDEDEDEEDMVFDYGFGHQYGEDTDYSYEYGDEDEYESEDEDEHEEEGSEWVTTDDDGESEEVENEENKEGLDEGKEDFGEEDAEGSEEDGEDSVVDSDDQEMPPLEIIPLAGDKDTDGEES
ncbi:hypothetical protein BGZ83_008607 [Gryganskiella cystojenkinii]|nr:hypothetical protein BGZ83_008607 [Gryganskiella cystojenkinii]